MTWQRIDRWIAEHERDEDLEEFDNWALKEFGPPDPEGPGPRHAGPTSPLPDPSPWQENAVRALEEVFSI